jgi:hypothetical protein
MASYVKRILAGTPPANLGRTADADRVVDQFANRKALGLDVPPMLIARADRLIE